jgi:hypothetical protein
VLPPLAILAALAVALALAGADGEKAAPVGGDRLDPDVALRVSATDPAQTVPQLASELRRSSSHPELPAAVRRGFGALARVGADRERELLARLSFVVITLERSCPPPAILACGPALRLVGRLRGEPAPGLQRDLGAGVVAALRATGYRRMVVWSAVRDGERVGRVTSRGETLGRWRVAGGTLEVTIGAGLQPEGPTAETRVAAANDLRPEDAAPPVARIETDPRLLSDLLSSPAGPPPIDGER